jgi:hypothetical protein
VPVGLTQEYWDTGDRSDIRWDAIHKLAGEQNGTPVASNGVVNVVAHADATSVEEDDTSKSIKLAKRVKLAKSTDMWCLSPFTPLLQEAKDKPRKVCPVNLRGRSARPTTTATNTRRSASWLTTARGKSPRPRARCGTCVSHLRETSPGGGAAQASPGGKGNNSGKGNNGSNARPAKSQPDKYLAKHEVEYCAEELKARIRMQKMMLQGLTYSQVAQAQAPAYVAPRRVYPAPAPAQLLKVFRTALTPDEAIAIFEETIERLRLR